MEKAAKKLLDYSVRQGYVQKECYDEYLYMLVMLFHIAATDITMLMIGLIMQMPWECIGFWLVYKALKKYAGGFHFSTFLRCYLSSCVMCPIALALIKFVPYNMERYTVMMGASVLAVFLLAPVEATNKPLDEKEVKVYGRVAKCLALVLFIIHIFAFCMKLYIVSSIVVWGTAFVIVFMLPHMFAHRK